MKNTTKTPTDQLDILQSKPLKKGPYNRHCNLSPERGLEVGNHLEIVITFIAIIIVLSGLIPVLTL